MFGSLKGRIINAHQDISASIRNLTVGDGTRTPGGTPVFWCSYNAGDDLLHKYKQEWAELHAASETNAKLSESTDALIGNLYQQCNQQNAAIAQLTAQLNTLPKLAQDVQQLVDKIGTLENLFTEIERELLNLEETTEIQKIQEQQLDERFKLALYKERKLGDLEQFKGKLSREHAIKVMEHEFRQQEILKERQAAFQEAFEEEIKQYKQYGQITKVSSPSASTSSPARLEDMTIEQDQEELLNFLGDSEDTTETEEKNTESES